MSVRVSKNNKRKLLTFVVILVCFGLGFGMLVAYQYATGAKRHSDRAEKAYDIEFAKLAKKTSSYGLTLQDTPSICLDSAYSEIVFINCNYGTYAEKEIDENLIQQWPERAVELSNLLDKSGWKKLPNHDPVTNNPVNSLDRLLEYKGVYPANVSYMKEHGSVRCSAEFWIEPNLYVNKRSYFTVDYGCNSVADNIFSVR